MSGTVHAEPRGRGRIGDWTGADGLHKLSRDADGTTTSAFIVIGMYHHAADGFGRV